MTISYTALLGLAQPVTGTETGQWGTVVNDEITALLEDAVANAASISVTAGNVTLSTTNGSSNQARMSTLIITGTPGTTRNVVAPSQAKIYVVINQSDGAVVIKGAATSGVTIGAGQTAQVAWNGSDFVEIGNYVHGNFVVNGNLSVNGDSTLGNAGADTTTINGQVIAANSNISKTTTLSASAPALAWIKGATYTDTGTAGGTTQALAPFTVFSTPTLSTSNIVTYTDAATVYIAGAPAAAGSATITNPYSLYVAAGNAYFGASVSATTLDLTNLEVTNIKAKDGTAAIVLTDSTGAVSISTNLTIGDASGDTLTINGTAVSTPNGLNFDSDTLVIDAANNRVGVGTNAPSYPFHVYGNSDVTSVSAAIQNAGTSDVGLRFIRGSTGLGFIGNGSFVVSGGSATDWGMTATNNMVFAINAVEKMRLGSAVGGVGALGIGYTSLTSVGDSGLAVLGNVGIGTNAPAGVVGTGKTLALYNTTHATISVQVVDGTNDRNATLELLSSGNGGSTADFVFGDTDATPATPSPLRFLGRHSGSTTELARITSDGNLLVGTTSASIGASGRGVVEVNGTSDSVFASKVNGTLAAVSGLASATEAVFGSVTNVPMVFRTNNTERARITSGGYFKASNTGSYVGSTGTYHEMVSNDTNNTLVVRNSSTSSVTDGTIFISNARNTTDNTYYIISAYNTTANLFRFRVADSGDVTNTNNSYGAISDQKMKTDIVDAGSQWSDIKALRFRKFKMKDDPSGRVQLGVVAQEVELTSPGLVDEHQDRDAEGNDLGTTTKSVKTSVLLMKAAVALQEAMARIETLEAEVAALKGA